ncbi:alpha/beta hydrolase [Vibrio penaeicida]|uniref:alpha/beta hydrolase n=1 Tax=Vibrio penaeicida TaxID=104609 RepID=UPI000CEA1017|nr:alpha/beta hydrolase [Vibrio penaeicida]
MKNIKLLSLSLLTSAILGSSLVMANDDFLGADLKSGKNKVSFQSENTRIAGNVFLPPNYKPSKSYPAIVVITPASGVKEQTAGIYAEKLALKGYIAMAFDHRTYGESGGYPRGMENAPMKVEDIKSAISFIRRFPGVDSNRVGELGLCSGAGYSLQTAMQDTRIDSVATVSGFVDFTDYAMGGATQYMDVLKGTPVEQYRQQIEMASEARQKYFDTGEVVLVDGIPTQQSAKDMNAFWVRAADYYRNPERGGGAENYTPMRAAMSLDTRYAFNPSEHMELLSNTPYMAVIGTEALSAYFSEVAVKRSKEKGGNAELVKIQGAKHFDLYDQEQYVNQAVQELDRFYSATLN